jgi:hypothetical protein
VLLLDDGTGDLHLNRKKKQGSKATKEEGDLDIDEEEELDDEEEQDQEPEEAFYGFTVGMKFSLFHSVFRFFSREYIHFIFLLLRLLFILVDSLIVSGSHVFLCSATTPPEHEPAVACYPRFD